LHDLNKPQGESRGNTLAADAQCAAKHRIIPHFAERISLKPELYQRVAQSAGVRLD